MTPEELTALVPQVVDTDSITLSVRRMYSCDDYWLRELFLSLNSISLWED